jgi:hypothetical protein
MKTLCVEHRGPYEVVAFLRGVPSRFVCGDSFYEVVARFIFYYPEDVALNVSWSGRVWYVSRKISLVNGCPKPIFACVIRDDGRIRSVLEMYKMFGRYVFGIQKELLLSIPMERDGCRSSNVVLFPKR